VVWLIAFVFSWVIFAIFVDMKRLRFTIYGGIITVIMGTVVDWGGRELGLYRFNDNIINWAHNSLFYIFGPVLTMGVLFFQFLNRDKRIQAVNILIFSLTYLAMEYLTVKTGTAAYQHWHYLASFFIDLLVFSTLSYYGEIIMDILEGKGTFLHSKR